MRSGKRDERSRNKTTQTCAQQRCNHSDSVPRRRGGAVQEVGVAVGEDERVLRRVRRHADFAQEPRQPQHQPDRQTCAAEPTISE